MKKRTVSISTVVLVLLIILAVLFGAKTILLGYRLKHDIQATLDAVPSSAEDYVSPDIHPPFGGDKSELAENVDEAINELYRLCHAQPEVLASTMSAFPDTLTDPKLKSVSAEALDDAMDGKRGGEIQQALLEKLQTLLEDPSTEITFTDWSAPVRMTYMVKRDENADATPSNMTLIWEYVRLEGDTIMVIMVPRADGTKDYGYFDMKYGFQRVVPVVMSQN